ncbi:uncharacterized protein [Haliotis asinina]|uniref:uncharacterized protein n=1 Tax=Haliotis asinina TaxID=109174 RepID=UPI0035323132
MEQADSVNMSSNSSIAENQNLSIMAKIDDNSRQPRIVFLALFILVTLIGNICLIIVVVQNKKYRGTVSNLIILNLTVVNIMDSVLNMPLVFGSLIAIDWVYGDLMCRFNTFFMNIVIVETVLTLTALTTDRFIAVKIIPSRHGNILSPSRTYIAIAYTWLHSFGFSLPLLAGAVPSTFRNQLHLCSISNSSSLSFICLTSIICFVVPVIAMAVLFALIFKAAYNDRFVVRSKLAEHTYTEKHEEKPQIWKEISMAKYTGVLLIIWFVFEVPYIVTAYIKQYQYSQEFQENPNIGQIDYPWVVDVTFVWVRFAFSGILPILTFSWKRELWRSLKDMVLCRRSNSVTDLETSSNPHLKKKNLNVANIKTREREKIESPSALTFNVPVLFATANGIHVQTEEGNMTDSDIFYAEMPSTTRSSSELKFLKGKKLDVSALEFIPPDTSDYDSNSEDDVPDQYSLSQPISTRQLDHNDLDRVSRSSSQPDVQTDKRNSSRVSSVRPFEGKLTVLSYGTDSGLDLSGTSRCHEALTKRNKLNKGNLVSMNVDNGQELQTYVVSGGKLDDSCDKKDSTKSDIAQDVSSTFTVSDSTVEQKSTENSLGATFTHSEVPQQRNSDTTRSSQQSNVTKKPPPHLEPLASPTKTDTNEFPQIRKKRVKQMKSPQQTVKTVGEQELVSGKDQDSKESRTGNKKSSKPGHKRQGTAESQRALLGSSSSAELQDMKTELQKMESRTEQVSVSGQHADGSSELPASTT